MILDGSNGVTFNDASLQGAAASPYVLKNRIINGAMQVWQRGTSVSGTYVYGTDRWATLPFATCNIAQSTSVPTTTGSSFQYSAKVGRTAASTATTAIGIMQTIESVNCYDLSGQTVTISFWAKAGANFSAASGTLTGQLYSGTVADQGGSTYYAWTGGANIGFSGSPVTTLTTSWQKFTLTGTFGAGVLEAALLFYFTPVGTAGADDNFYITGVQLEIGSTATPFERRLYNQELANCQRYYWNMGTGNQKMIGMGAAYTTGSVSSYVQFPVTMRATPTLIQTTGTDYYAFERNGTSDGFNSFTGTFRASDTGIQMYSDSGLSGTAGHAGIVWTNNNASSIAFNIEL
jgi:hypothetical protein